MVLQIDSVLEREMLEPWDDHPLRCIKDEFIERPILLGISTPKGLIKVGGKLKYLSYPYQIFISDVPNKFFEELIEKEEENLSPLERGIVRRSPKREITHLGMILNREYDMIDSRVPNYKRTLRSYFTEVEHAVKTINIDGKDVFENPFVRVPYVPFESIKAESKFRLKLGFPILGHC